MKKRLVSLFLCMALLFSAAAVPAFADDAGLSGYVESISLTGSFDLSVSSEELKAAGIAAGDIVTVTVAGKTADLPVVAAYGDVALGESLCLISEEYVRLGMYMSSFASALGLASYTFSEDGVLEWNWNEGIETPVPVTVSLKEKNGYAGRSVNRVGILSMLNVDSEGYRDLLNMENLAYYYLQSTGCLSSGENGELTADLTDQLIYFDRLTDMISELDSGRISKIMINKSVAEYLVATRDGLAIETVRLHEPDEADAFGKFLWNLLYDDFSFMFMEQDSVLRDEMDVVITEMLADGTIARLVDEYITGVGETDPAPVEIREYPGSQEIRVAVTGDLPPMDLISADDVPAGFSTAVLAEIGKRLARTVVPVPVSAQARSLALVQGNVDVVFWTRSQEYLASLSAMDEAGREEVRNYIIKSLNSTLAIDVFNHMYNYGDPFAQQDNARGDIPEGTIVTTPYLSDPIVLIVKR